VRTILLAWFSPSRGKFSYKKEFPLKNEAVAFLPKTSVKQRLMCSMQHREFIASKSTTLVNNRPQKYFHTNRVPNI